MEKEVLVTFRERRRPVTFKACSCPEEERKYLKESIKTVFEDVLPNIEIESFILLVKSERWQGEFMELRGDMKPSHNSVVELSLDAPKEVSCNAIQSTNWFNCLNSRVGHLYILPPNPLMRSEMPAP